MNNYTHPYSDYVNHILNKSPSKTAYSFSKAERFPQMNSLEFDQMPTQETYRNVNKNSSEKRQKSPIRPKDSQRRMGDRCNTHKNKRLIRDNVEDHLESNTWIKNESRSKSPIRQVNPNPQHQACMHGHQKTTRLAREYSYY